MLNRIFTVDSVTLTSTGTAVSSFVPYDQTTRKLPSQVVVKATGQGAYVRLSDDQSAATNADVLVQAGDHVVLTVNGRHWVSVLSDGASSTVNIGALSTGVWGDASTLSLNFVAGTLDSRVTFTRASTATYFDATGTLQSAAIDAPRFDYNPSTLAARGLLIEEQRTNAIANNTATGAIAGTPGTNPTNWIITYSGTGITREIVGTGTEDGINYIDLRFYGIGSGTATPQITPTTTTEVVASAGQTWAASYYLRIVGGSTTGIGSWSQVWIERNASGVLINSFIASISAPTTAALRTQRSITTRTLNDAGTARVTNRVQWTFTDGVPVDITLRIGLPQLEQGAFATSVIQTSGTALTRSADVASVNTLSPWYNATEGTLFAEWTAQAFTHRPATLNDGTQNNAIALIATAATIASNVYVSSVFQGTAGVSGTFTTGTTYKQATAYKLNDTQDFANGVAGTTDTTILIPTVTQLLLGAGRNGMATTPGNGWLRRFTYYPRRLSQAEGIAITA